MAFPLSKLVSLVRPGSHEHIAARESEKLRHFNCSHFHPKQSWGFIKEGQGEMDIGRQTPHLSHYLNFFLCNQRPGA